MKLIDLSIHYPWVNSCTFLRYYGSSIFIHTRVMSSFFILVRVKSSYTNLRWFLILFVPALSMYLLVLCLGYVFFVLVLMDVGVTMVGSIGSYTILWLSG
jgi:hypothetical protein